MMKDEVFSEEIHAVETDYEIQRDKPMPSYNHSLLQIKLGALLFNQYGDKYQFHSELELDLPNAERPTLPDICVLPKQKIDWINDVLRLSEPPLTTIEILSPMQNIETLKTKIFSQYFPAGVKSAWLVVPSLKTISIYTPDGQLHSFSSGNLHDPTNDISLNLEEIFNV